MELHHKNCGGELYIKEWTDYGSDEENGMVFGVLPDYYCRKCDEFILGDAMIAESTDDIIDYEIKNERILAEDTTKR